MLRIFSAGLVLCFCSLCHAGEGPHSYGQVTAEATAGHASASAAGGGSYGSAYAAAGFGSAGGRLLPGRQGRLDRRAARGERRFARRAHRARVWARAGGGSRG
jgi:hypothetical protein